MAEYHVYLRSYAEGKIGRILGRIDPTCDAKVAEAAYRRLLARDELAGQPMAAVLSSNWRRGNGGGGTVIYFSRFDDPALRIPAAGLLDLKRHNDGTAEALAGHRTGAATDWEADPRPFAACLMAWCAKHGWEPPRAALELRVPPSTYDNWCAGRGYKSEATIRRLMTLIERFGTQTEEIEGFLTEAALADSEKRPDRAMSNIVLNSELSLNPGTVSRGHEIT